jgi:predicted nuclease of predicted toxin-antitoxin system
LRLELTKRSSDCMKLLIDMNLSPSWVTALRIAAVVHAAAAVVRAEDALKPA